MSDQFHFAPGRWDPAAFAYVYSPLCRRFPRFHQAEDGIENRPEAESGRFEYISMVTKKRYPAGTILRTRCRFAHYGAPLIVLTDDIRREADAPARYGLHFEIVAYEGGVNVWRLIPEGTSVRPENIARLHFPVTEGEPHTLTVRTLPEALAVSLDPSAADGSVYTVPTAGLPRQFHAGVTACEGIDRFFDFEAREPAGED